MDSSKTIILTKRKEEGERLLNNLKKIGGNNFSSIKYMTKEDVESNRNLTIDVTDIFSTWYMPSFDEDEIRGYFPHLQNVFYAAGTVKYFASPFLRCGVRVFSAGSANGVPVAEYAAAQIILSNKGCFQAMRGYRWSMLPWHFRKFRGISERKSGNYNASVGLIGCGVVGSKVVRLLQDYDLNIYVYDPYLTDKRAAQLKVRKVSLQDLFSRCDVISNHLPDTPETREILNYALFALMKPTATFINTGRGRQVVERDLAKVLRKNKGMCALLDVTTHEPLYPWNPLYRCPNVFLTPHIAGSLSGEIGRMAEYMVRTYYDVNRGDESDAEIFIDSLENKA